MLRADLDRISHAIFHEYQIRDQCHVSDTSATRRVGDSPGAQAASRTADSARVLRTHAMPLPAGIGRVAREDADRGNHRPVGLPVALLLRGLAHHRRVAWWRAPSIRASPSAPSLGVPEDVPRALD